MTVERLSVWVLIGIVLCSGLAYADDAKRGGLAVLPIAGDSQEGTLAKRLVGLLSQDHAVRVVAPDEVAIDAGEEFEAREIRRVAQRADVDAVVTGRLSSGPTGRTLETVVRSGHSGALISEYRVTVAEGDDEEPALSELAGAVLESLGYERLALPAVAAGEAAQQEASPDEAGLEVLRADEPVSIRSNELEVTQRDDRGRRLVFVGEVRVVQGETVLEAERLEAFYPEGSSRPQQLEATGSVRVTQGEKQARCEEATYDSALRRVSCRGRAELAQGCETVRGREIEFDLARERVRVLGAASVVLQAEQDDSGCGEAAS